MKTVYLD